MDPSLNRRNVALDVALTLLLCGLWNLVVQWKQIQTLNTLLREEKFRFWKLALYSLLTCGIYLVYFEYKKSVEFNRLSHPEFPDDSDATLAVILAIFGLHWIYDAILQSRINEFLLKKESL